MHVLLSEMRHGNSHKFLLYSVCLILNVCNIKIFTMVTYIVITLRHETTGYLVRSCLGDYNRPDKTVLRRHRSY